MSVSRKLSNVHPIDLLFRNDFQAVERGDHRQAGQNTPAPEELHRYQADHQNARSELLTTERLREFHWLIHIQGDKSCCFKPPADMKTKGAF